jgi:hypothetical protein
LYINAQSNLNEKKAIEIRIDMSSAQSSEHVMDCFSSVSYLPLQTTKQSAFGEISQMEITTKYYIIWDEISNCILTFNKAGEFVSKITNTDKLTEVPFKKIYHFSVDEEKGQIMFSDRFSQFMYYYTLNGKFIKKIKRPNHFGLYYISRKGFNAYFLGYDFTYLRSTGKPAHNFVVEKPTGQIELYLPFDTSALDYTDILSTTQAFYNNQNGIINCSSSYNYNIYSIDSLCNVWNSFRFVMPAVNTVPDDFLTNSSFKGKRMQYTASKSDLVFAITDFYQCDDELIFKLDRFGANEIFTYNLKSGNLRSLSNLEPDKTTFLLPALGKRIYAKDNDKRLVSSIDAASMFVYQSDLIMNNSWAGSLSEPLKKFFKLDGQQNPVLTILTLK